MKFFLYFCFLSFSVGSVIISHKGKSRQKRQVEAYCSRNESYPCTKTITEQVQGTCFFNSPCIVNRQRQVPSTCFRQVLGCCAGFRLVNRRCFVEITEPSFSVCSRRPVILTSLSGVLTSPNYPRAYPRNAECNWAINMPPNGRSINVQVTFLHIQFPRQSCFFGRCTFGCSTDYLSIDDGRRNMKFCGTQPDVREFSSTRSQVRIRFRSDFYYQYTGFRMTYQVDLRTTATATTGAAATTTMTTATQVTTRTTVTSANTATSTASMQPAKTTTENTVTTATFSSPISITSRVTTTLEATSLTTATTTPDTKEFFRGPPLICSGGRIPTNCTPTCTPTCRNYKEISHICSRPVNRENCIYGCACPIFAPVDHNGYCLPSQLCPQIEPTKIQCGTQFYLPNVRIVGGATAKQHSWPWAVQIIKELPGKPAIPGRPAIPPRLKFQCGGTVICESWVVTAAHCFVDERGFAFDLRLDVYKFVIGQHYRHNVTSGYTALPDRIIVHPEYSITTVTNDIALVHLQNPLRISRTIRPACLPNFETPSFFPAWGPRIQERCYAVGWGSTRNRGPSNRRLKQVQLTVQPSSLCENVYRHFRGTYSICIAGKQKSTYSEDTCQGDSGGPLLCKHGDLWYVDGITSHGLECGPRVLQPSVYTRVSSFSNWIRQQTGRACGHTDTRWTETNS